MFGKAPFASVRTLSTLGIGLIAACGSGALPGEVQAREVPGACEYCGVVGDAHETYRTRSRWLEELTPEQLELVREELQGQSVPVQSASRVCPRSFGPLPARDEVLIAPVESELAPDLWRRKWAVVGRDPWAWQFVTIWHAVLGDVLRPEQRQFDAYADCVWYLELRVERCVQDDGRVAAKSSLIWSPSSETSTTTASTADWVTETPSLEQLVVASSAHQLVKYPSDVVLAVVDGNPVTLRLRESGQPQDEEERKDLMMRSPGDPLRFRYPWNERTAARIYAGEEAQPDF